MPECIGEPDSAAALGTCCQVIAAFRAVLRPACCRRGHGAAAGSADPRRDLGRRPRHLRGPGAGRLPVPMVALKKSTTLPVAGAFDGPKKLRTKSVAGKKR